MLSERLADRPPSSGGSRSAFFFDLACPLSYVTAEQVERALGEGGWAPCNFGREHAEPAPAVVAHAERQARALQLPLIWPDRFPASVPTALRAAAYAAEVGAGSQFALAASRLAFCGGY